MNSSEAVSQARSTLESVIATAELHRRAARAPDHEALSRSLISLAQAMTRPPRDILQKLVETAMDLCQAHSAGVSLLEDEDGREVFRWHAISGQFAHHLWGTMPREHSPCGTVLDRDAVLLMDHPDRYFSPLLEVAPRIHEALLVPFHVGGGQAVGTLWVLSHDESRRFDAEDVRVITSLGDFAAAAYQSLSSSDALKATHAELAQTHAALLASHASLEEQIAEREQAERALREANSRKDEFLAILAHELRNPLAPIRNSLEIVREANYTGKTAGQAYKVVERQVSHLVRLVDDLLDASRVTRGKIALQKEPFDLAIVVARAVESSRPFLDSRNHTLELALPETALPVEADLVRLEQVLINLLNNAAKYTPAGGHVWLIVEKEAGQAVIRVRDTGIGIPPEMLPKVFDLFTQLDHTLARAEGGLGIGLTLVRRLVQMHGGAVEAFSEGTGRGSEIVVRLPLRGEERPAAEPEKRSGTAVCRSSRRILVVDDDEDSADSLALLLRLSGNDARAVYSGDQALAAAEEDRPEVVLLDIGLPEMDGLEVCRRLRQELGLNEELVIAMTGYAQEEDKRRSREAGFDHHLVKPIDPQFLRRLLAEAGSARALAPS
jgi:signal transduction histidine kinase/ActR/RegA family two-component response regulator